MRSFVDLYEEARGKSFDGEERRIMDAANLWLCAYMCSMAVHSPKESRVGCGYYASGVLERFSNADVILDDFGGALASPVSFSK